MTLKQRALVDVLKLVLGGLAIGIAANLLVLWLGLPIAGTVIAAIILAWFCKVAYDIRVGQLQFEADRVERALKK